MNWGREGSTRSRRRQLSTTHEKIPLPARARLNHSASGVGSNRRSGGEGCSFNSLPGVVVELGVRQSPLTQRGSEPFPAPGDDRWVELVARDPTDHAAEPAVHHYFVEEATEAAVEVALWRLAI